MNFTPAEFYYEKVKKDRCIAQKVSINFYYLSFMIVRKKLF